MYMYTMCVYVNGFMCTVFNGFLYYCHICMSVYFPGSEEKVKVCREYGAHLSINYKEQNFAEEVLSFTGNKGTLGL